MITYRWSVTRLETVDTEQYPHIVIQAYWKKIGTDEQGVEGEFLGATPFSKEEISLEQFINFDSLNEETVLSWIAAKIDSKYESHINRRIQEQIDKKNSTTESPDLPWL